MSNIPKIIHQIWFNFENNNDVPEKFKNNIESWKNKNKNFNYKLWDLESAILLIKEEFPGFLDTFNNFKYNICKCDFFRYILLYKFGGIYVDLDFYCLQPIDIFLNLLNSSSINQLNNVKKKSIILTEEWPNSSNENSKLIGSSQTLHNGILISENNHPFWMLMINNCLHKSIQINGDQNTVFEITGTRALCKMYKKNNSYFNDIVLIPNYYFCSIYCNFKNNKYFGFPEQYDYLDKTSDWCSIPNEESSNIDNIKEKLPWSFALLMSFGSLWKK